MVRPPHHEPEARCAPRRAPEGPRGPPEAKNVDSYLYARKFTQNVRLIRSYPIADVCEPLKACFILGQRKRQKFKLSSLKRDNTNKFVTKLPKNITRNAPFFFRLRQAAHFFFLWRAEPNSQRNGAPAQHFTYSNNYNPAPEGKTSKLDTYVYMTRVYVSHLG